MEADAKHVLLLKQQMTKLHQLFGHVSYDKLFEIIAAQPGKRSRKDGRISRGLRLPVVCECQASIHGQSSDAD